jgi:hypothetical protein
MRFSRHLVLALAFLVPPVTASAADVVFFDDTFPSANYAVAGTFTSNSGTIASSTCATCGNPSGPALQFVETYSQTTSAITDEALLNETWVYNPATQGAINGISASVDKDLLLTVGGGPGSQVASGFHPTVEQDGNLYVASIAGLTYADVTSPYTTGYATITGYLPASAFTLFDFTTGAFGTGNPNFTATGDPITLGITQFGNIDYATTATVDYDNYELALGVAEPATWAMMLIGIGGVGAVLRRRGKRSYAFA